jgi:hypothetical protein
VVEVKVASLEVSREVTGGFNSLLKSSAVWGRQIFPQDINDDSVVVDMPNSLTDEGSAIIVGDPRFHVYSKLMLPLIQFAGPPEYFGSTFRNIRNRLESTSKTTKAGSLPQSIAAGIRQISYARDVMVTDEIAIHSSSVIITQAPQKRGSELALVVDDGSRFVEEHEVYMKAIRGMPSMRKKLALETRYTPVIPFAVMAPNATMKERDSILGKITEHLRSPLRLVLGGILPPFVR